MSDTMVGKGIDRLDGRLKVTGKATFSAEVAVANVAYGVIVGSSIAKGRIASVETHEAENLPGVLKVLTHENAPKLPGADSKGGGTDRLLQLLQNDNVLYDGQPVGLVIATSLEVAEHAASLVRYRYEQSAPEVELSQAAGSAFTPASAGPAGKPDSARGDFAKSFAGAKVRVEETYTTHFQTHNPMEPHATLASWQGTDGLTIYDATQGIFSVKKRIAKIFGIAPEGIRVISHFVGGGFGCKGSSWSHVALAVMAAREVGRPVKVVLDRSQMFQLVGYRPTTIQKVSLGASADGKLLAIKHDGISSTSQFDDFVEPTTKTTKMLYACADVTTSLKLVKLDTSTPTFTRAPGEASGSFALESAMDELAYALKMDPIALRLKNHADTDLDAKKPFSSKSLKECYQRGADAFGWAKRKPDPRSMRDGHALIGWGMATATYPANHMPASALARIEADGSAVVLAGSQDIGTGTYTIMAQIAADMLSLPMDKVHFDLGDTIYPETSVSGGSSTAASVGSVVKKACLAVRAKIVAMAIADAQSPLHGMSVDGIDIDSGILTAKKDKKLSDSFASILARSGMKRIEEKVEAKESESRKGFSTHSFGAQFAEVRVDEDLGTVRVSRLLGAYAAGKILNVKTARSQFMGGMIWGLGFALLEATERDLHSGRLATKDLADYHVPVNADAPLCEVIMVDEVDAHVNEIGAKGIGEIGITGMAAAIANAVFHATGKRIRDLPITLDKIIG